MDREEKVMMHLEFPQKSHEKMWFDIVAEFKTTDIVITPYALTLNLNNYDEYLIKTTNFHNNINVHEQFVSATTYFLMDEKQDKILGAVNIRHMLNDYLLRVGGNIGYGIAPSERRKGYATKMLSLSLDKCREIGLEKVLLCCNKSNIGSAKTIKNNGGILENEIKEDNGNIIQRYWINLKIKIINFDNLPSCLEVVNNSFATVAKEFGLTEQNCPTNPAFIKIDRLINDFNKGSLMFGYFTNEKIVGFVQITKKDDDIYELGRLAVLPEYRHSSIGKKLIGFAKEKVQELGGKKITIGIIEENTMIKNFYTINGFIHTGTMVFAHLPFTVGYMAMEVN